MEIALAFGKIFCVFPLVVKYTQISLTVTHFITVRLWFCQPFAT